MVIHQESILKFIIQMIVTGIVVFGLAFAGHYAAVKDSKDDR